MIFDYWLRFAACRGEETDLFFPAVPKNTAPAVAICSSCHVQTVCLDYALDHPELMGVWGGTSERQRNRMRRPGLRVV